MKRTEPSVNILHKRDYVPSWMHIPQTAVVPYLSGHRGLMGLYRDRFSRNTKEADK
jgi:hypothetical protein